MSVLWFPRLRILLFINLIGFTVIIFFYSKVKQRFKELNISIYHNRI